MEENSSKISLRPCSISHLNDSTCEITRLGIFVSGSRKAPKYFLALGLAEWLLDSVIFIGNKDNKPSVRHKLDAQNVIKLETVGRYFVSTVTQSVLPAQAGRS